MTFERTKDYPFSGRRNADRARMPAKAMRETPSRAGGMAFRSMSLTIASILLCAMGCGCASAPEPRDYAADNSKAVRSPDCPDLSGVYEGRVRQIVEGYGPNVLPLADEIFHAENIEAAEAMRAGYRRDANGRRIAPDATVFQKNADGNYTVTTYYGTFQLGSLKTRFNSQVKVSCEAGTIGWIAPEQSSRSEFGPNYSFSGRSVRLDSNGDILLTTWTHMSYQMALLWLPMGAGTDKTVYRYKRLHSSIDH
ncbi:hypothetical protein [Paraburkholderia fungorum]|jgi:hypothetical protein|uniref:hypothetical protein n=1 Tax=Paraburkholderia fungorum TaxID=134537 RepID=UPI0015B5C195|nr:hypothetical protein [Paraburkholderia fungorum]QLD52707.1 hypothetical protein C9419_28035 [Paraburkholderia fungorum]